MATFTVRPEGIIRQPALTMPGNATGSEAACTALTGSQIRAICGLGTTDNVTFNTVTATTSVLTPLLNNTNAAALTLGNSTYGVTVPGVAHFGSPTGTIAKVGTNPATAWSILGDSNSGGWGLDVGGLVAAQYSRLAFWTSGTKWVEIGSTGTATFSGHVLFTDDTYDIGASGATRPRTVYAGTSVITPLLNNSNAAALTLGNSTYGVTVPGVAHFGSPTGTIAKVGTNPATAWSILGDSNSGGWGLDVGGLVAAQYSRLAFWTSGTKWVEIGSAGAATFSGDISMSKTSAQGYISAFNTTGARAARLYQNDSHSYFDNTGGNIYIRPTAAAVVISTPGVNTITYFANIDDTQYVSVDFNSIRSTGNLNIVPTGGTVAVTGAVTASGRITTYAGIVSSPTSVSNNPATGVCDLLGTNPAIAWSEFGVDNRGVLGFASGSTTLSYRAGGANFTTYPGTEVFTIGSTGNVTCAGITASGAIQETYRTSSLDPTVSDIGSGKRQGWYNTTATEFRDWVNVGGTLYKSAAYT